MIYEKIKEFLLDKFFEEVEYDEYEEEVDDDLDYIEEE